MNLNLIKGINILIGLVIFLFYSCNLDYAPSVVSTSVLESKKMGFFLFEYKVDSMKIFDQKKTFIMNSVWLEKSHTSTMSTFGNETFHLNNNLKQIVFSLKQDSYLNSDNFDNWIITNSEEDLGGLQGHMVYVRLNLKETTDRIRFRIYTLKKPGVFRYDTVKVAEFVLKKHLSSILRQHK